MEKYSETIQPQIKGVWNADETLVLTKRGKDNKTSAEKCGIYLNNPNKWGNLLLNSIEHGRGNNIQKIETRTS